MIAMRVLLAVAATAPGGDPRLAGDGSHLYFATTANGLDFDIAVAPIE